MTGAVERPAYYATGNGSGGVADWISLLHPPYTAWHLSYVAIGAAVAPTFSLWRLGGTLLAFFLAVGVGAHAVDEWHDHPLRTGIRDRYLVGAATASVGAAVALGLWYGGWKLLPFVVVGALLVVSYNLELFGGLVHNRLGFALAWGAFPVLTAYYAQDWSIGAPALAAAVAATALSWAQRSLSAAARTLRRRVRSVDGTITLHDGTVQPVDAASLLLPLEQALKALPWAVMALAAALVSARL